MENKYFLTQCTLVAAAVRRNVHGSRRISRSSVQYGRHLVYATTGKKVASITPSTPYPSKAGNYIFPDTRPPGEQNNRRRGVWVGEHNCAGYAAIASIENGSMLLLSPFPPTRLPTRLSHLGPNSQQKTPRPALAAHSVFLLSACLRR